MYMAPCCQSWMLPTSKRPSSAYSRLHSMQDGRGTLIMHDCVTMPNEYKIQEGFIERCAASRLPPASCDTSHSDVSNEAHPWQTGLHLVLTPSGTSLTSCVQRRMPRS